MTLALRLAPTHDNRQVPRLLAMRVGVILVLILSVAALVFVGTGPTRPEAGGPIGAAAAGPAPTAECSAALRRARASKGLPSQEAVARSTAMLRACKIS
ncbi:hypothetical protein [Caulobacter hibisci]|uniref:Uncharacterized protein n=1 Tax=Caulobacter hibisci TaxID=2035993 RepID=A0ABS0SWW3_9CAUL|nr:hypothetical protein [Caulobacter hibisci]MBI1684101.1 hypothetical protein [Caulobacter hibisci]